MANEKKYNLKDVAEKAGVSLGTASKVINQHYVRPELRIRVEEAMRTLNYIPNEIARSLKSQKSKTIGVMIPDISSPINGNFLRGIESIAAQHGYTVIIYDTNLSNATEEKALSFFKEKMVSGIIYASNTLSEKMQKDLIQSGIPTTLVMTSGSKGHFSTIQIDNEEESYRIVKMMTEKGYERILHLAGERNDYNAGVPRLNGYKRALKEVGISYDPELVVVGGYRSDRGYRDIKALLGKVEFDAIFAASDEVAIGAMKALREANVKVPEEVAIAGFDGISFADYVTPSLCTVEQPFYLFGEESMRILIDEIEQGKDKASIVLKCRIKNENSIPWKK